MVEHSRNPIFELKSTHMPVILSTCLKPPYMVLHSNKEGEQKETEKKLARLVNTGRYECGVRVNGYGFE